MGKIVYVRNAFSPKGLVWSLLLQSTGILPATDSRLQDLFLLKSIYVAEKKINVGGEMLDL